jgi:hypothetical protein
MYLYIIILLLFFFAITYVNLFLIKKECPASQVIYKYLPEDTLDIQFNKKNDALYNDMFNTQQIIR